MPPTPMLLGTWRDNADGHERDMFLFMQIQLLQPHLELDEGLDELQAVSGCKRERLAGCCGHPQGPSTPLHPPSGLILALSPSCYLPPSGVPGGEHGPRTGGA